MERERERRRERVCGSFIWIVPVFIGHQPSWQRSWIKCTCSLASELRSLLNYGRVIRGVYPGRGGGRHRETSKDNCKSTNLSLSLSFQPGDSCTRFTRANDFSCFASHREKAKPKKGNSRLSQASMIGFAVFFSFRGSFLIEDLLIEISVPWYIFFWIS